MLTIAKISLSHTHTQSPNYFLLVDMWSELVHNIHIKTPEKVLTLGKQLYCFVTGENIQLVINKLL